MAELKLTKENFDEVIKSGEKTLVDFWAPWCGPCRMLGPIIEEIANEVPNQVGKVNVDEEEELAAKYGVSSIPTVIVFQNGKEVARTVGYQPKANFLKLLK